MISLTPLLNLFLGLLLTLILIYKHIGFLNLKQNFQNEEKILKSINNYKLNSNKLILANKEKIIGELDNVWVYTFTKSQKKTLTKFVNHQISIWRFFSTGESVSSRNIIYKNSLRKFGKAKIILTKLNLIIYTTNGHYNIKSSTVVYIDKINKNTLLIIEKNKKSLIFKANEKNINKLQKWYKYKSYKNEQYEVSECYLNFWIDIFTIPGSNYIKYEKIYYQNKIIAQNNLSGKKVIEQILIYLINEGLYLQTCNELLSLQPILNKQQIKIKQQMLIGNYYLNTSNNIKLIKRYQLLMKILENSSINVQEFKIAYTY